MSSALVPSAHPQSSADMRSLRGEPLERRPSDASSGSRQGRVLVPATALMMAANALNNVLAARFAGVRPHCVLSGSLDFHAAHVLPHSYWSSARLHEWLYYAGVIPNGGESTRELAVFKYSERNILWLSSQLASRMEPTKGELIVVPELETLIIKAEETLAAYEADHALDFSRFTSPELLAKCDGEVTAGTKSAAIYPYSVWLVDTKASLTGGPFMQEPMLEFFQLMTDGRPQTYKTITTRTIPLRYNPPLRRGYKWCLDPIIAGVVAWKAINARLEDSRLSLAYRPTLDRLDHFLALCETDSLPGLRGQDDRRRVFMDDDWTAPRPSKKGAADLTMTSSSPSKRTDSSDLPGASRPARRSQRLRLSSGDGPPASAPASSDPPAKDSDSVARDSEREDPSSSSGETKATSFGSTSLLKALPEVAEENEAATEDDGTPMLTLEDRWHNCRIGLEEDQNRGNKGIIRLIEKLDAMEDRFVDDARRAVRSAFKARARREGFSRAMRWLRCDDDGTLDIDDEIRRIQKLWLTAALAVVAAWSEDDEDEAKPTGGIEAWLADATA